MVSARSQPFAASSASWATAITTACAYEGDGEVRKAVPNGQGIPTRLEDHKPKDQAADGTRVRNEQQALEESVDEGGKGLHRLYLSSSTRKRR